MLILIAESKTMAPCRGEVAPEQALAHTPEMLSTALALMQSWRSWPNTRLSETMKVSPALARAMQEMIYDFPNRSTGSPAIEAYTGVVFKALDFSALSAEAKARADRSLRIISSLYGWLRPADIIKPYRLDFTTPMAPGGATMARFWRPEVTARLAAAVQAEGSGEILDLMPADAARCIDWKAVAPEARLFKADFKETADGGAMRTPRANRLKTLRGLLLRHILTSGTATAAALRGLDTPDFYCDSAPSPSGNILIHC